MVPVTPKPYFNCTFLRPEAGAFFHFFSTIQSYFRQFLPQNKHSENPAGPVFAFGHFSDKIIQPRILRRRIVVSGFNYNFISTMKEV